MAAHAYKPCVSMKGLRSATLSAAILLSACAGGDEYIVIGGARVPSTAGLLTVDADDDSSELELSMEFLPAPQTLSHKLTHYVAWILPRQGSPVRLGALHYVARERTARLSAKGWPDGVTRIRLEYINPGLKGNKSLIFTKGV